MKLIQRLILISAFIAVLAFIITYARGYRLDLKKKSLTPTGILVISSSPKAAKIYINGQLKGATDTNLTLPPGNYQVEIKKEGFTSWSKIVKLKGELVLTLEALLFPLNPSLSPLTNLGIIKAVPLDATEKILLFTQNNNPEKDGIYLYEASKKPVTFFSPLKLITLKKNLPETVDFAKAQVFFSPDYKQAIIEFSVSNIEYQISNIAYLFSLDSENQPPFDITGSKQTLIEAWEKESQEQNQKILEAFPKEIAKIASDSFRLIAFSPNETKILYQAKKSLTLPTVINPPLIATNQTEEVRAIKKDSFYVYDKKEDKNYEISLNGDGNEARIGKRLRQASPKNETGLLTDGRFANLQWFPDSKHLVFIERKKIVVVDYDGTNKQTVYSGPFENSFFTITAEGQIIVLANLNPETNPRPDLYMVGIR